MFDWILDFYNWRVVIQYIPEFQRGLLATAQVSAIALVIALVVGTASAIMSLSSFTWLRRISAGYIAIIRSTPLLIQIYVIYFALGPLGLNAGAFMSEIIRAGIESVETGQVEGAKSVGMSYVQRMRYVILPQGIARVLPPLMGQTAVLIKDSSLVSFIGVFELFGAGLTLLNERLMPNEAFLTVAMCYLAIYYFMFLLSNQVQRKLGGAYS